MNNHTSKFDTDKVYAFTQVFALVVMVSILWLGLLPALLGGLFVYFIVEFGTRMLGRMGVIPQTGKIILLILIAVVSGALISFGVASMASYLSDGPESVVVLFQKMADIVDTAKDYLPLWVLKFLPENMHEWQTATADWLRDNAGYFGTFGQELGVSLVRIIIGMIIGGLVAINPAFQVIKGPLAQGLSDRIDCFSETFRRIVFSQIRISALNTFLTGIFLAVVLPIFGFHLPFLKTMIVVTFLVGLMPIIGNLISNTVIFLIALSVSPIAAVGSLAYLVVIHKLEYFINAHIIGTNIKARAWELLLAMLVMETIFGIAGLIVAPIYYAYIKNELSAQKLI